jgi:hypothetical protein
MAKALPMLEVPSAAGWRDWLAKHHASGTHG